MPLSSRVVEKDDLMMEVRVLSRFDPRACVTRALVKYVIFLLLIKQLNVFVFKSLWQDKTGYYYVFGFLAVVGVVLIAVIMEVTVIVVYIQLCSEVCPLSKKSCSVH